MGKAIEMLEGLMGGAIALCTDEHEEGRASANVFSSPPQKNRARFLENSLIVSRRSFRREAQNPHNYSRIDAGRGTTPSGFA
jgi:hypothetical protein